MSKLNIKPIEAGISVAFAISEGLIFKESDLSINLAEYESELVRSFQAAIALASESAYITKETINPLITRAHNYAIALSRKSHYLSRETLEQSILPEAQLHANLLTTTLAQKGYAAA